MQLAMLQFERKQQMCIRMGITIFKFSFREVQSENMFYGSAHTLPYNYSSHCISDDIPPQMKILNTDIP